jgi:hypothetical protein
MENYVNMPKSRSLKFTLNRIVPIRMREREPAPRERCVSGVVIVDNDDGDDGV